MAERTRRQNAKYVDGLSANTLLSTAGQSEGAHIQSQLVKCFLPIPLSLY